MIKGGKTVIFEIDDYLSMQDAIAQFCLFLAQNEVSDERVFDSRLVANELVGNVLRHSRGKAKLCGDIRNGFVELTVFSSVSYIPPKRAQNAEIYAEHGRGLYLVDSVCHERTMTKDGGILVRIRIK